MRKNAKICTTKLKFQVDYFIEMYKVRSAVLFVTTINTTQPTNYAFGKTFPPNTGGPADSTTVEDSTVGREGALIGAGMAKQIAPLNYS